MIRHIVCWRWQEGSDVPTLEDALTDYVALQSRADGAVAASWSRNRYGNHRGFTHVVVGDFVDEDAVESWVTSARHAEALGGIRPFIGDFCVIDLEEPYAHQSRREAPAIP